MGDIIKYMLIVLGPAVYFDIIIGVMTFTIIIDEFISITLSFGTPASMSCKIHTVIADEANPIFNYKLYKVYTMYKNN